MVEVSVDADERLAEIFKALGHPARLAIVKYLAENKQCVCGNISDKLPLAKSTVSQHLKKLKEAGIIVGVSEGQNTCYCLNTEGCKEFGFLFDTFRKTVNQHQECC